MIDLGSDMPVIAKRCAALTKIAAFVNMKSVETQRKLGKMDLDCDIGWSLDKQKGALDLFGIKNSNCSHLFIGNYNSRIGNAYGSVFVRGGKLGKTPELSLAARAPRAIAFVTGFIVPVEAVALTMTY
jgi:hypothetical protein